MQSDMGWQYQDVGYCGRLEEAGIVQSMSRKGNCVDNGATEQVFGHLKDEFFRGREFPDFETFKKGAGGIHHLLEYANTFRRRPDGHPPSCRSAPGALTRPDRSARYRAIL